MCVGGGGGGEGCRYLSEIMTEAHHICVGWVKSTYEEEYVFTEILKLHIRRADILAQDLD